MIDTINSLTPDTIRKIKQFIVLWDKSNAGARKFYEKYETPTLHINLVGKQYLGVITCAHNGYKLYTVRTFTVDNVPKPISELKEVLSKILTYPSTCPLEEIPLIINAEPFQDQIKRRLSKP